MNIKSDDIKDLIIGTNTLVLVALHNFFMINYNNVPEYKDTSTDETEKDFAIFKNETKNIHNKIMSFFTNANDWLKVAKELSENTPNLNINLPLNADEAKLAETLQLLNPANGYNLELLIKFYEDELILEQSGSRKQLISAYLQAIKEFKATVERITGLMLNSEDAPVVTEEVPSDETNNNQE